MDIIFVSIGTLSHWKQSGYTHTDAAIFNSMMRNSDISHILLVNGSYSSLKLLLRRIKNKSYKNYVMKPIMKGPHWYLSQINSKLYSLDYIKKIPFDRKSSYAFEHNIDDMRFWLPKIIRKSLKILKFNNPVLFVCNPLKYFLIGNSGEKLSIFYCVDNWLVGPPCEKKYFLDYLKNAYNYIEKKADILMTVNLKNQILFPKRKVYLISTGVDVKMFNKLHPYPKDIETIPHPIIGYVGRMQSRLDTKLIEKLANKFSDYSFVFVGDILRNKNLFRNLFKLKNIHFLGAKHHSLIPSYIHSFDVCIIPHKGEQTKFMSPIKLYEYLACGKPVISSPVIDEERFQKLVYIANDEKEWETLINKGLCESDNGVLSKKRKEFAKRNSWGKRVEQILKIIYQNFRDK